MYKKAAVFMLVVVLCFCVTSCRAKDLQKSYIEYDICATLNGNMTLDGTLNLTYTNFADKELKTLQFNLYANAYREGAKFLPISQSAMPMAFPNGQSFGKIEIVSVLHKQSSVEFEICGQDENILQVNLPCGLYPNETINVTINYILTLANTTYKTGYYQNTVTLFNWFPILCVDTDSGWYQNTYYNIGNPFYSQTANYRVSLTMPMGYTVATSGNLQDLTHQEQTSTYTYKQNNIRDFALVLSKDFNVEKQSASQTQIDCYYEKEQNQDMLLLVKECVEYFNKKFGEYPYSSLSIILAENNIYANYPCLSVISKNASAQDVVYNIAHQWWYGLVGTNQEYNAILTDGLCAISTALFFENSGKYQISAKSLIDSAKVFYREFTAAQTQGQGLAHTKMNRHLSEYKNEYEYKNIIYNKSLIMLDIARTTFGEKKFDNALSAYLAKFKYKNAQIEDFVGFFEKSKIKSTEFFYSFIDGNTVIA